MSSSSPSRSTAGRHSSLTRCAKLGRGDRIRSQWNGARSARRSARSPRGGRCERRIAVGWRRGRARRRRSARTLPALTCWHCANGRFEANRTRHDIPFNPKASAPSGDSRDRPLCPRQEPRCGCGEGPISSRPMNPLSVRLQRRSKRCARWRPSLNSIPTARRQLCARRSAAGTASIRHGSSAATAPMSCWRCWRTSFLHPGDEGLYSEYGFLTYPICIRAAGGVPVVAKETDRTASVDALLAKVTARTKIVYLANQTIRRGLTSHSPR